MVKPVHRDGRGPKVPELLEDAAAAVLVLDVPASHVLAGNRRARALGGLDDLPVPVAEWFRRAGLQDPESALDRAGRGEPVAATVTSSAGPGYWLSAVPLAPAGDASERSLLTLVEGARVPAASRHPAVARLSLLADVAEAASDLDSPVALQRVADVLAPGWAPWSALVVADGHLRVVAAAGDVSPPGIDAVALARFTEHGDTDPVAAQLRAERGEPVQVADAAGRPAATLTGWLAGRLGPAASRFLSVPVPGRREVLGALLVGLGERPLDGEDVDLLVEVARRVGLAVENARLYAREHALAETLQRSMLPEQAGVPGLDVWSYYAPNPRRGQVGGDWYDVLQLGPGAVGLVVGDVVGHDVEAAASMGQLRSLVRAYASDHEDPAQVLMRVDQLVRGMRIPRSASLVLATLTRDDDCWELEWSRAGHLPPLLVRDRDVTVLSAGGGALVGVGDRPRTTGTERLLPGDVVLLYTDGLIERRARALMDGLQLLREVGAGLLVTDAAGIGEQLLAALGDQPEDDMAVVVLRLPRTGEVLDEAGAAPRQRRWQLPGDPSSIGRARRLTVRACAVWGLDCGPQAELVVSELVANAVLHGWGPVGLRLRQTSGGLDLEVDDDNPMPPAAMETGRGGLGGYGLHVVQRLAEWGWRPAGSGKTVWARVPTGGRPGLD